MPVSLLGESTGNISYTIKFTEAIKKVSGASIFSGCSANYFSWEFIVSNRLDLTPPIVVPGQIFPIPDNEKDVFQSLTLASPAKGKITVNSCPQIYSAARVLNINPSTATVTLLYHGCLLYTSPSPRDRTRSRMPSSA